MIRYYYAGAARIAMRTGTAAPQYILSDHLGSTSVTASSTGVYQSEVLYKPCPFRVLREGETRWTSGTLPTKYTYTGQYSNVADFGLMYYNARWYDSSLSRFAQADTLIPNPGDPQRWDRYAYVRNSPTGRIDPTGHMDDDGGDDGCESAECRYNGQKAADWAIDNFKNPVTSCPPGTTCTCFAASAVNNGYLEPLINSESPAFYRTADFDVFLDGLFSSIVYENIAEPGSVYGPYNYPIFGPLIDDEAWETFIYDNIVRMRPGDIVLYHEYNNYTSYNHAAVIVGFESSPEHDDQLWPLIVDQAGVDGVSLPRFLDHTNNVGIKYVKIIFMGR